MVDDWTTFTGDQIHHRFWVNRVAYETSTLEGCKGWSNHCNYHNLWQIHRPTRRKNLDDFLLKVFLGNKSAIGLIPCGSNYKAHQNSALESHLWLSYVELKKIWLVSLKATEFLCQETVEPWKFHHRDKPFGSLWPVQSTNYLRLDHWKKTYSIIISLLWLL